MGLKQSEIANQAGINQNDISRLETGKREFIPNKYIFFLADKGLDMGSLFDNSVSLTDFIGTNQNLREANEFPVHNITIPRNSEAEVYLSSKPNSIPNSKGIEIGIQKQPTERVDQEGNKSFEEEGLIKGHTIDLQVESYDPSPTETVTLLDIEAASDASKGYLSPNYDRKVDEMEVPRSMLEDRGIVAGDSFGFPITNDRMSPTLQVKDILIVSESRLNYLFEDNIYIIISRSKGVLVNRIKDRLDQSGVIKCSYDNHLYEGFNINKEDISDIYEAKFKISFNLSNHEANTMALIHNLKERIEDLEMKKDAG